MKKIRLLAILVIVAFIVDIVTDRDGAAGFKKGWDEAGVSTTYKKSEVTIHLEPVESLVPDSLINSGIGENVPYRIESLSTVIKDSFWNKLLMASCAPFALFGLYGFYCMFRVVLSVSRGNVFTRQNANRIRIFAYSMILMGILMELHTYLEYRDAVSQIQFSGYEIVSYALVFPWFSFLILALFTEIFAVGVKLKEEQDLTI